MYVELLTKTLKDTLLSVSERNERAASTLLYATYGQAQDDSELILQVVADLQQQAEQLRKLSQSLQ